MLFVLNPKEFVVGKYIPLVATVEPDGINRAAVSEPPVVKFVPSKVKLALPTVNPLELYKTWVVDDVPTPPLVANTWTTPAESS